MRKRRWLFWLVMVLATFALAIRGDEGEDDGAGGTPPAGEPEMEKVVEVPDENVLLQGELNPNIHEVQEDEILTAHYGADTYTSSLAEGSGSSAGASASGTQFPDYMTLKGGARGYQPGHILVCPRNERTPHEYAVVIESVSAQPDGSEYCGVRRVGIDDVVTDGNVFLSAGAHPKYTLSAARNAGKRSGNDIEDIWEFIKTGSNASAIMDYPAVFSYPIIDTEISTAGSSALKTEFQKYLGFEVESDFNILAKLDMMILASVEGGVTGKAALVFPGRFKAGGKFEVKTALKKEFDEIDLTKAMPIAKIWFNIGSVPVYMNINLNPVVKLEASVAAKLSSSVEYGISGMFGFYYEDSAVRGVPLNPQPEMEGSVTPENDTEGYAKLSIAPKITCGFYNMADGLSIKAGPAFKGAVKQSENAVTLEVEASVKASADLLNVFKHVATLPGIKTELILWEMDPPIELLRIPLPGGGTTPTLSPATSGNWIDIKSTSWYDKDPSAASFEIDSAEGLAGLAYIVNIRGTSHDNFYGKTITLTGNIDLGGREWTPIGTTSSINYYFQGTFDGGSGYTIANLTIKHEGSYGNDYYPAGLFGGNGGTIINV
ncbi:MAG: hypothetical protein LBS75_02010, partial [Synergistaceae bacterium]|nr:hypothetical protein [Synergistaceae bacterium]